MIVTVPIAPIQILAVAILVTLTVVPMLKHVTMMLMQLWTMVVVLNTMIVVNVAVMVQWKCVQMVHTFVMPLIAQLKIQMPIYMLEMLRYLVVWHM
jgi:hypothetical protein